jgi:hypothetical protein
MLVHPVRNVGGGAFSAIEADALVRQLQRTQLPHHACASLSGGIEIDQKEHRDTPVALKRCEARR